MVTYKPFKVGVKALTHSRMFNLHKHAHPKLLKRLRPTKPIHY